MTRLVTECDCHDTAHMMAFWFDVDERDPEFDEFYVETQLNQCLPWWKRLSAAVQYVFGRRSRYSFGHWSEGSIGLEGAKQLREALTQFIQRRGTPPGSPPRSPKPAAFWG